MDVYMPVLDGHEAAAKIRQTWPQHQQPWIIAMTASTLQRDRDACAAAGMNDYITKPIRMRDLATALNKAPAHRA